jgi:hypothetical protein
VSSEFSESRKMIAFFSPMNYTLCNKLNKAHLSSGSRPVGSKMVPGTGLPRQFDRKTAIMVCF